MAITAKIPAVNAFFQLRFVKPAMDTVRISNEKGMEKSKLLKSIGKYWLKYCAARKYIQETCRPQIILVCHFWGHFVISKDMKIASIVIATRAALVTQSKIIAALMGSIPHETSVSIEYFLN